MPTLLECALLELTRKQRVVQQEALRAKVKLENDMVDPVNCKFLIFDDCGDSDTHVPLREYYNVPTDWDELFRKLHENVTHAHNEGRRKEFEKTFFKGRHYSNSIGLWTSGCGYGYGLLSKSSPPVVIQENPRHYLSSWNVKPYCITWCGNSLTNHLSSYADALQDTDHHRRALALWACDIYSEQNLDERFKRIRSMHPELRKLVQFLLEDILPTVPTEYTLYAEMDKYEAQIKVHTAQLHKMKKTLKQMEKPVPVPSSSHSSPLYPPFAYNINADIVILDEMAYTPPKRLSREVLAEAIEDLKHLNRLIRHAMIIVSDPQHSGMPEATL